jgi:hypothetical protein
MSAIQKCTLVPSRCFEEGDARCILGELYTLAESETVSFLEIPRYDAVFLYSTPDGQAPVLYDLVTGLDACPEYNKILLHYGDGILNLAIAQGGRLLLANSYPAPDFTTAEYYLFLAVKSLQINPEVSTVTVKSPLSPEEELSLYRYFKSVEQV